MAAALIDTSAILAILDASESRHAACLQALASLELPLLTTEAVLTEFFHFILARSLDLDKAWGFVRSGAIALRSIDDTDLPVLCALMKQYEDRPMDFADATLVHLGARERLNAILTLDYGDFETYRLPYGKRFRVLPLRKN
jgi:uncharacterized protein